jgi:hypothetical protein
MTVKAHFRRNLIGLFPACYLAASCIAPSWTFNNDGFMGFIRLAREESVPWDYGQIHPFLLIAK